MHQQDKQMLDKLIEDKGRRYRVAVDNDYVCVIDKLAENEDNDVIHYFDNYGWHFVAEILQYLGLDADEV